MQNCVQNLTKRQTFFKLVWGHLKIAYCDNLSRTTVFFGSLNFDTRTGMSC